MARGSQYIARLLDRRGENSPEDQAISWAEDHCRARVEECLPKGHIGSPEAELAQSLALQYQAALEDAEGGYPNYDQMKFMLECDAWAAGMMAEACRDVPEQAKRFAKQAGVLKSVASLLPDSGILY